MATSLQLKTSLRTGISPTMRMMAQLLPLSITDLSKTVKKELSVNPALIGKFPLLPGDNRISNVRTKGKSLAEHLFGEIRMSRMNEREQMLCEAIVCELDEFGMFRGEEASMMMTLSASADEIEAARKRVMMLDPKGCGAKDLSECLAAQIGIVPVQYRQDVLNAIENLRLGISPPTALMPFLKKMKAAPGKEYDYDRVTYINPDIVVDKNGNIQIEQQDVPELSVSPKYIEMAKDISLDEETRSFAREKVEKARNLIAAINSRHELMKKIATLALLRQKEFFAHGIDRLRRQTEKSIAAELGCSVSMVSRAANRKFVKTPRGTFPFRLFFPSVDQEPIAKLRELIKKNPKLSDRKISDLLTNAGYKMSRRTVNKYRRKG